MTIRQLFSTVLVLIAPFALAEKTPLRPVSASAEEVPLGPYAYDATGSIRAIGGDQYTYDTAGRLVRATVKNVQQNYAYDAFGNRTAVTGAASYDCVNGNLAVSCGQTYTTSPTTNQLLTVGGVPATYDVAGNLTAIGSHTYQYDSTGMMVRQGAGASARQYIYTADDERLATYAAGQWEWTIRDGARILREITTADDATAGTLPT